MIWFWFGASGAVATCLCVTWALWHSFSQNDGLLLANRWWCWCDPWSDWCLSWGGRQWLSLRLQGACPRQFLSRFWVVNLVCLLLLLLLALVCDIYLIGVGIAIQVGGCVCVFTRLQRSWQQRLCSQRQALPFLIDLFVMVLESGVGLQVALQHVHGVLEQGSAIRDELGRCLAEIRAGHSRRQSMRLWACRYPFPELQQWVWSMEQAEDFGLSLAPLLRTQAEHMRGAFLQEAEKRALQAPVKLLLPLALCFMPCTFLVLIIGLGAQLSTSGVW